MIGSKLDWMRPDWEYWLSETPGFEVRGGRRRIGIVEYVRYASSHERPDTLHLRTGVVRLRRFAIRVEDVAEIDPVTRTVWLTEGEEAQARGAEGGLVGRWMHRDGRRGTARVGTS